MEIYEVTEEKMTVLYDDKKHRISVYNFIVPKNLLNVFNITKENLLLYHSAPLLEKRVRGGFNEQKLKRITKDFKNLKKELKIGK